MAGFQPNAWSLLGNQALGDDELQARGLAALKSGQITPQQVAKATQLAGMPTPKALASPAPQAPADAEDDSNNLPPGNAIESAQRPNPPPPSLQPGQLSFMGPPSARGMSPGQLQPGRVSQEAGVNPNNPRAHTADEYKAQEEAKQGLNRTIFQTPDQAQLLRNMAIGYTPEQYQPNWDTTSPDKWLVTPAKQDPNNPIYQQMQALKGSKALQAQILALRQSQPNLSPLAALTDALTGSRFTESYRQPATYDDLAKSITGFQEKSQDEQRDISKQVNDYMKNAKAGTQMDLLTQGLNQMVLAGMNPAPRGFNTASNYQAFTRQVDHGMKDYIEQDQDMAKLSQMVNGGVPIEANQIKLILARAEAKARVNMMEMQNAGGDPALGERVSQAFSNIASGTLTPQNRAEYNAFIKDLQTLNHTGAEIARQRFADIGNHTPGLSPEQVKAALPDDWVHSFKKMATKSTTAKMPGKPAIAPGDMPPAAPASGKIPTIDEFFGAKK